MQKQVLKQLEDAWIKIAKKPSDYLAILNAAIIIISNANEANKAARFYAWWHDALQKTNGPLPEAVFEIADSLRWGTPMTEQEGLVEIRSLLAIRV